jgi:hypothetical protein
VARGLVALPTPSLKLSSLPATKRGILLKLLFSILLTISLLTPVYSQELSDAEFEKRIAEIEGEQSKRLPVINEESILQRPLGPSIKTFFYLAPGGKGLAEILKEKIGFPDEVLYGDGYLDKITSWNRGISDLKNVPMGTRIYIEHPYDMQISLKAKEHIDSKKLNAYRRKFKRLVKARLKKKRENEKHWNISSHFGLINITSESDNTLSMNFKKVGLKYGHRLSQNYRYFINLSIVQFGSIDSSKATDEILAKSFLPEFGFGVSKKMSNKFSASLSYDFLNYFFINSKNNGFANISTDNIHRISIKPYYVLSPSLGALGSLGFIAGTASGFDLSLGINYSFGKKKNYSLALITYISSLDVSGNKESSNAHIVSFGYKF